MKWHEPNHPTLSKLLWMANCLTEEEDLHLKARSKTVIISVSKIAHVRIILPLISAY